MDASITGIRAASDRLAVSAHNVANINTPNFKALRAVAHELPTQRGVSVYTVRSDSGADLGTEMVDQLVTLRYAQANMKVLRVQSDLMGSLVNLWG